MDNPDAPMVNYAVSTLCTSYIDGFLDGLRMAGSNAICFSGASLGTMARVYVVYVGSHPKLLDEEKSIGLTDALLDGYPCPAGPKKK